MAIEPTMKRKNVMFDLIIRIPELSDSELQEYFSNAQKTYYKCSGHKKAQRNENLLSKYEIEAMRRELHLDRDLSNGVFNGKGSS